MAWRLGWRWSSRVVFPVVDSLERQWRVTAVLKDFGFKM
jgi:hypothetical protein